MAEAAQHPQHCRHTSYPGGVVTRCQGEPILSGYCRAHVPDHIARQHYTRVLIGTILRAAKRVIEEGRRGAPSRETLDALDLAYTTLEEWRRLA